LPKNAKYSSSNETPQRCNSVAATTTKKSPATEDATASVGTGAEDRLVTKLESDVHRRNRLLRERYIELSAEYEAAPDAIAERRIKRELDRIADEFVVVNAAFATAIVSRVKRRSPHFEDLYQESLTSLWKYFLTWDPERAKFTTYALTGMQGDVARHLTTVEGEGTYADTLARNRAWDAQETLTPKLGRKPTVAEIAQYTGLPEAQIKRAIRDRKTSLDKPVAVSDGSSVTLLDALASEQSVGPDDGTEDAWLSALSAATSRLSIRDTVLLIRRNGLDGWPEETLAQLASWLGVGREILRRAEARARETMTANGTRFPTAD